MAVEVWAGSWNLLTSIPTIFYEPLRIARVLDADGVKVKAVAALCSATALQNLADGWRRGVRLTRFAYRMDVLRSGSWGHSPSQLCGSAGVRQ